MGVLYLLSFFLFSFFHIHIQTAPTLAPSLSTGYIFPSSQCSRPVCHGLFPKLDGWIEINEHVSLCGSQVGFSYIYRS